MHHNERINDIDDEKNYHRRTHLSSNMESPSVDTPSFKSFSNKFQARNLSNDSGYTTFTQSSAESSIFNAESSNISLSQSFPKNSTPHNSATFKREAYKNTQAFNCDTNLSEDIASIRLDEDRSKILLLRNDFCEKMETDSFNLVTPIARYDFLQSSDYDKSNISSILHKTPKKSTRRDLNKKNNIRSTDRKTIKRHSFKSCDYRQKIGTPEKNQLLYSNIKPVTPPRKSKTPERCIISCKKVLYFGGVEKVDFLKWFQGKDEVIGVLLSLLEEQDLVNVCKVSEVWKSVCMSNPKANRRRLKYLEDFQRNKENHQPMVIKEIGEKNNNNNNRVKHVELMEIQNICNLLPEKKNTIPRSPPVSPSKRKHHKFVKAASQGCEIRRCIKCDNPAIVKDHWAICQSPVCTMVFCNRCHFDKENCDKLGCKLLTSATSPYKEKPRAKSLKTNRKNLKRLLF